jgi:predicted alpha/beta-hydrolase family hydrolase
MSIHYKSKRKNDHKPKRGQQQRQRDWLALIAAANAYLFIGGALVAGVAIWAVFVMTLIYIWIGV